MVREAEKNAAADAEKRETVEAINQAESIVNDTQSKMTEYSEQLNAEEVFRALNNATLIRLFAGQNAQRENRGGQKDAREARRA